MRAAKVHTAVLLAALFFASAAMGQTKESSQELAAGRAALRQHRYSEAIHIFEDALKKSPGNQTLRTELGRAYLYDKQDEQAMKLFRDVLKDDPGNRVARLELARALSYHQDYEASNRLYRELLKDQPDEGAEAGLVRNLMHQGKTADAQRELELALTRFPNSRQLQEHQRKLQSRKRGAPRNEPRSAAWENQGRALATTAFYGDSATNRSWRSSQEFDYRFTPRLGTRFQVEERTVWTAVSPKANVLWGTSELQFRPVHGVVLSAGGGAARFANGGSKGLFRGEADVHPMKDLWITGEFFRSPIAPTFLATQYNLVADTWGARLQWNPQGWRGYAAWRGQNYSDTNSAKRAEAELVRWFGSPEFSIGAGYQYRYIGFTQTLLHGYFNPNRYHSHLAVAGFKAGTGRFRGEYLIRIGKEKIAATPYQTAWEVVLRNRLQLRQWELGADYIYFHLAQDAGPFNAQLGRFLVGYRF